ncbi:hypothetical protein [Arthrobacter sp. UYEF3]|uniref:hypothetical protein n=1 Tax=Arthrobacter sp. UYEF3 TaxID=1756365 RepID=UPI0033999546
MSSQHPGADNRPSPEPGSDAPPAPDPVATPYAAGRAPGQYDPQTPAPAAGWGAPPPISTGPADDAVRGMPRQAPTPAAAPGWGASGGAARSGYADKPWTLKRRFAVGGAAAVLAVGAGVGVYALTSSSAAAKGTAAGAAAGRGPGDRGLGAQGVPGSPQGGSAGGVVPGRGGPGGFTAGGMGALTAAVHAEYVVLEGSAYTTMAEQLGTVTEVSSTSVTVKSGDGFTRSYGLGADVAVSDLQQRRQQAGGSGTQLSVADIVPGGTVRIVAAKDGANFTASAVTVVAATATGQTN